MTSSRRPAGPWSNVQWPNGPWSTGSWSSGQELRIGDAERESAARALGEHFAEGRLTKDEYDERAERAWAARTASDLRPLFADLPAPRPGAPAYTAGPGARVPARTPSRPRLPFLPVLLVLIGLALLVGEPWLVFVGLGVFWFARSHRRGGCVSGQAHRPR